MSVRRVRPYGLPGVFPSISDTDIKSFGSHEFDVGLEHTKELDGKRFIARKDGSEFTFQTNEGTKDEPKLRSPSVDEMKAGLTGLSAELNRLSELGEESNGALSYPSVEVRDRIRALNQVFGVLERRIYAGMGIDFDPKKSVLTLELGGKVMRVTGKREEATAVLEVQESGVWRPAGDAEKGAMAEVMYKKLDTLSGVWKDPVRVLLDMVVQRPSKTQPLEDVHHPTAIHFDPANLSFRFFQPADSPTVRYIPNPNGATMYLKGFGFQLRPLANERRAAISPKDACIPPLCGFYVKEGGSDWAPAELPDMMVILEEMEKFRTSFSGSPEASHRLNFMIKTASQEIQRPKAQESKV